MKPFTKDARAKGWTLKALAARWGITDRGIQKWATRPKQLHVDALKGVEDKSEV